MTSSFQSTSFQPAARPVDTFVAQPTVLPMTDMEELATTLATINPNIQKFIGDKVDIVKEEEINEGQELVMNASKDELAAIMAQLKKNEENDTARQLIGSSIFVQAGIERQLAINLGATSSSNALAFFNNYTVEQTDANGSVIQIPLTHFDINSDEFQAALAEFQTLNQENTAGIRPLYMNQFFLPQQGEALNKIFENHITAHNEYKVQKYEGALKETILLNFNRIDEIGIDEALTTIQNGINEYESVGLLDIVSPTSVLEMVNAQANNIFLTYKRNGLDGFSAALEYLDFVGELKVGQKQLLTDGTVKQSSLSDFYNKTTIDLYIDLADANDKFDEATRLRIERVEEATILEMLDRYSFVQTDENTQQNNYEIINAIVDAFPHRFDDFIEPLIEEQDISREEFYRQFKFDLVSGKYGVIESRQILENFQKSLGSSLTAEDETELDSLFTLAKEINGRDLLSNYRSQIDRVIKEANSIFETADGVYQRNFFENENNLDLLDAQDKFNNRVLAIFTTTELKEGYKNLDEQYAAEFQIARKAFLADAILISQNKYVRSGILKELESGNFENYNLDAEETAEVIEQKDEEIKEEEEEKVTFETIQNQEENKTFIELIQNANKEENEIETEIKDDVDKEDSALINNELLQTDINKLDEGSKDIVKELENMGGVTRENIDKLIADLEEQKKNLKFSWLTGTGREIDQAIKFLQTGEYGDVSSGTRLFYEPLKTLAELEGYEGAVATPITKEDIAREIALDVKENRTTITVKEGDTLTSIAEDNNVTVDELIKLNNITNPDLIKTGDKLKIKENTESKTESIIISEGSKQQAIVTAAKELGVSPEALAAVISQETMGTFNHLITGGDGGNYKGLIQFGIEEQKVYGYRDDMTFEEQILGPVVNYLKDRGVKPGHGVKEIYAAILTGNVSTLEDGGADFKDSFGTSVNTALPQLIEGGEHYLNALDFLQEIGKFTPNPK
tara:strand:+ start:619 stop:3534 length:2916 start_codon:yes stop_codon:yes gene_type:complete